MLERDYYEFIGQWLCQEKSCELVGIDHKFDSLELLTGDVVVRKGNEILACEVKLYPYPVGAMGYGSIGQALALKSMADFVYVVCIASELPAVGNKCWMTVSQSRAVKKLMKNLGIEAPITFELYHEAVKTIFQRFFEGLGLGLLVVREESKDDPTPKRSIAELVPAEKT